MPDKQTLVRPDGSLVTGLTPEQAEILRSAGYGDEAEHLRFARNQEEGLEEYFTRPGQQLKTAAEGLSSGLSFGITDAAFDAFGWDTDRRAERNPGIRLGSEIVGAIAPSFFAPGSGLAKVIGSTPAGLVTRGATRVAPLLAEGRVAQGAIRGAIEGAAGSVGAEVTNSVLTGDPLTAEAVVAGVGFGGLLGGALGGLTSKLDDAAHAYAANRAEAKTAHSVGEAIAPERYSEFSNAIGGARKSAAEAVKAAEEQIASVGIRAPIDEVAAAAKARTTVSDRFVNETTLAGKLGGPQSFTRATKNELVAVMKQAAKHIDAGDFTKAEAAIARHGELVGELSRLTGIAAPELAPIAFSRGEAAASALEDLKALKTAAVALDRFPSTSAGFAAIGPGKMEKHIAAVDTLMKKGGAELEGVRSALKSTIGGMAESLGVKVDGGPAEQLRGIWQAARGAKKVVEKPGLLDKAKKMVAGSLGQRLGIGAVAGQGVTALLGLKAAVLGGLQDSIAKWAPRATGALVKVNAGARVDPLRRRLDGSEDAGKKNRRELMRARAEEIAKAAPTIRETLYKAIAPLAAAHPEFAAAAHKAAVDQFDSLVRMLPRDPGTSINKGVSTWAPDMIATEKFARIYEVFHDPAGAAQRAVESGKITPEAASALKVFAPQLFQTMRMGMLEKLSEPGQMENLTYRQQIEYSQLLDVPFNSVSTPRFIAAQQQMYAERTQPNNQPTRTSVSPSNNPSGGRPPGATAAQSITEH